MIPISQPIIAKAAKRYVLECLRSGWVSSKGPFVERFEKEFADFLAVKHAVATSSGTSALHLALAALRIGPGDEVIVPALTMIAAVLPVIYVGATPVLVEVEEDTGNLDSQLVEAKITKRTRAIIAVHLHGHPVDMEAFLQLAKRYKLAIIEDAAEAHGAEIKFKVQSLPRAKSRGAKFKACPERSRGVQSWKRVGSIGDIGCFSFYGNKIITTGEGGMIVTNNPLIAERMRSLRNLARTPGKHFLHQEIGFTYRLSNLQAALGLAELEEVERFIKRKRQIANYYNKLLKNIPGLILPVEKAYAKSVFWQYGIVLPSTHARNRLERILTANEIETRRFFTPIHQQPAFRRLGLFTDEFYPVSEGLSRRGLCLPSGVAMTNKQIEVVCEVIKQALA